MTKARHYHLRAASAACAIFALVLVITGLVADLFTQTMVTIVTGTNPGWIIYEQIGLIFWLYIFVCAIVLLLAILSDRKEQVK